jgi:methyl-accepting chemotaxis protein
LVKDRIVPKLDERDAVIQQMNQQMLPKLTLLITNMRYSLDSTTKMDDAVVAGMHMQKAGIYLNRFIGNHQALDLERTRLEIDATYNALTELLISVTEERVRDWAKQAFTDLDQLHHKLNELSKLMTEAEVLLKTTLRSSVHQMIDTSQRLQEEVWHNISMGTHKGQESIDRMSMITQILTVLGLFIGVMMTYFIGKIITSPIKRLGHMMEEIALTGRFHHRSDIVDQDEIGKTAQAMNQLLSSLEQAISETNQVVASIAKGDLSQRIHNPYVGD